MASRDPALPPTTNTLSALARPGSENDMATVILASISEAVIATDALGHVTTLNAEAERLTGWSSPLAAGRAIDEVFHIVDLDSRAAMESPALAACRENRAVRLDNDALLISRDGREFVVEVSAAPLRGEAVQPLGAVQICRDVSDTRHLQRCIAWQAGHDALTHLPNRNLLTDRLRQAVAQAHRQNTLLAVCYLDLDGFKSINDRYGHDIGDRVLVNVAERLTRMIRGTDTVARIGGDEFVLLLTGATTPGDFEPVLERLIAEIALPYQVDARELAVTASIGVAICPLDDADPDTILRHADQAMYYAKQTGRNRYQLFDAEHDRRLGRHREELDLIRKALNNGQAQLHYQPKVNIRTGSVVGVEALLRWYHPERGLVPVSEFLGAIARTDVVETLDRWVIENVLCQLSAWQRQDFAIPVAINISPENLERPEFVDRLKALLTSHGNIDPGLIELEVVESSAINDMSHMSEVIAACHALGVTFSLDDFGTGYSCLSNLRRLPVDGLKIDQTFVRDMLDDSNDLAIVEGIISLAQIFQSHVIAEGVETSEHAIMLMRLGCNIVQGFGIAKPMPADELVAWVRAFKPDPRWALWADTQWELTDFPLLVAQYDHIRWIKRVVMAIDQPVGHLDESEVLDMHACRFGHWYDHHGRFHYGDLGEFADIDPVHQRVHAVGGRIIRLHAEGRNDAARKLVPELLRLKDQVLDQLQALQVAVSKRNCPQP